MFCINKTLKGHNSIDIINKISTLYAELPYEQIEMTKLPKVKYGRSEYIKEYSKLFQANKRRVFGLSYKSFKNKKSYNIELNKFIKYDELKKLNKFIKEQLNGGFSFDGICEIL